jgi:hypothetical protein
VNEDIEIISFLDNNAYCKGHSESESSVSDKISIGKVIEVDNKHMTVGLLKQCDPAKEQPLYAKSQCSFQFLPNGNKFIKLGVCWCNHRI